MYTDVRNYTIFYFFLFWLIFTIIPSNHDFVGNDAINFIIGIKEDLPNMFIYPLLYYVGTTFYSIFGDGIFTVLPLLSFGMGILFLVKLFEEFKLDYRIIGASLFINFLAVNFLFQFTRDSIMFGLASVWAYFFLKLVYHKYEELNVLQSSIILLGLTTLLFFTRGDSGLIFVLMFVCFIIYKIAKLAIVILPEVFSSTFSEIPSEWPTKLVQLWTLTINNIFSFNLDYFLLAVLNPVFMLSSFLIWITKDRLHGLIILLTLGAGFVVSSAGFAFAELGFRYLFALTPFHIFYVGVAVKKNKLIMIIFIPLIILNLFLLGLKILQ